MSLFKSKMHQIRSLVSVRLSVQMEFDTKYVDGFFSFGKYRIYSLARPCVIVSAKEPRCQIFIAKRPVAGTDDRRCRPTKNVLRRRQRATSGGGSFPPTDTGLPLRALTRANPAPCVGESTGKLKMREWNMREWIAGALRPTN